MSQRKRVRQSGQQSDQADRGPGGQRKVRSPGDYYWLRRHTEARDKTARDPAAFRLQARSYALLNDPAKEMEWTDRFLAAAPNHPFGYDNKAMILLKENKPREA